MIIKMVKEVKQLQKVFENSQSREFYIVDKVI